MARVVSDALLCTHCGNEIDPGQRRGGWDGQDTYCDRYECKVRERWRRAQRRKRQKDGGVEELRTPVVGEDDDPVPFEDLDDDNGSDPFLPSSPQPSTYKQVSMGEDVTVFRGSTVSGRVTKGGDINITIAVSMGERNNADPLFNYDGKLLEFHVRRPGPRKNTVED